MLSAMTPVSEQGRGYRWGGTMAWFIVGSIAGGATLGLALALGALIVGATSFSVAASAAVVAVVALVCAASDLRVGGFHLPLHYRQVNEVWFATYRRWVYASGYGWQLGVGVATFITTAAIYLMIAAAALTGEPLMAFGSGVAFGAIRALAILPARSLTSIDAIRRLHERLEAWAEPSRFLTIGAQFAIAVAAFLVAGAIWFALATALLLVAGAAVRTTRRRVPAHP